MPEMSSAISIPCQDSLIVAAQEEADGRIAHMNQRYVADPAKRREALVNGYIVEKHVYDYLKARFEEVVQLPPNAGDYTRGLGYDFSIVLPRRVYRVEVYSQLRMDIGQPYFRIIPGKRCDADLYLFARYKPQENEVAWEGWCDRQAFDNLPRQKDTSVRGSNLIRWSALNTTSAPDLFIEKMHQHLKDEDPNFEVVEPVFFDGPDRTPLPVSYSFQDRKAFFRKDDSWRDCEPKNFEVKEGVSSADK